MKLFTYATLITVLHDVNGTTDIKNTVETHSLVIFSLEIILTLSSFKNPLELLRACFKRGSTPLILMSKRNKKYVKSKGLKFIITKLISCSNLKN